MKTVWFIDDVWGYWGTSQVFATKDLAESFVRQLIDDDDSWDRTAEGYISSGYIEFREVRVIE